MPKEVTDIRAFLRMSREKDAKVVRIKRDKKTGIVKFKLRRSSYLYTLKVADKQKADKISQSFPPGLKKEEIPKKA